MGEDLSPARKVVSRAPSKTVRVLNLAGILDAPVECESSLERDFVYRAVLCPSLVRLRHQPFKLTLPSGRKYTPDFLVTHCTGDVTVVEVKPLNKLGGYRAIFDAAATTLAARGHNFAVLTDRAIRADRTHERAALILRYRKTQADPDACNRVLSFMHDLNRPASFNEIVHRCAVPAHLVMHLLAARRLASKPGLSLGDKPSISKVDTSENRHAIRIESWFGVAPWSTDARIDAHVKQVGSAV